MVEVSDKLKEILDRKNFTSFWSCFDYLKLANYEEIEALMIAGQRFNWDIWSNVIHKATNRPYKILVNSTGSTHNYGVSDEEEPDDLPIEIFLMTKQANPSMMPIYKAYVKSRDYEPIETLEKQIKSIKMTLTTELAMALFKDSLIKK